MRGTPSLHSSVRSRIFLKKDASPGPQEDESPTRGRPSYTFAFLKTCRQIHSEAHTLPWELNTFSVHSGGALETWGKAATLAARVRMIRTIRLCPIYAVEFYRSIDGSKPLLLSLLELTEPRVVEVLPLYGWGRFMQQDSEFGTGRIRELIEKAVGSEVEVKFIKQLS